VGDGLKEIPVQIDKTYEINIKGYSSQGEGIGRIDNFIIFIPGAIYEERVRIRIVEVRRNFGRGIIEEIILPSNFRVNPPCSVYNLCGGCQLQHLDYEQQLKLKRGLIQDALTRLGKIDIQAIDLLPVIGMHYPWRYRNKGRFQVKREEGGRVRLGFYQRNSHNFIPARNCLLFSKQIGDLIDYLEELLNLERVAVYDERTQAGNLRNILFRESKSNQEIMLVFISKENELGIRSENLNNLIKNFSQVSSIYQNINWDSPITLWGKEWKLLKGKESLEEVIHSFKFRISPTSFFQINVTQAKKLYKKILSLIKLRKEEVLLDLYCGAGAISIYVAKQANKIYGVEIEKEAVKDARVNAELNHLSNLNFFLGQVEDWLNRWGKNKEVVGTIIVDPPRAGCSYKTLLNIIKIKPRQIIYVSCNPATLARDIGILVKAGFQIKEIYPLDMFPQTSHLEAIACLER